MERLRSRKLWAAVAGIAYFLLTGDPSMAGQVLLAYLATQGVVDAAGALKLKGAA